MFQPSNIAHVVREDLFLLEPPKIDGDLDGVLVGGYCERNADGLILVHRIGPFVPPIAFSNEGMIVANGFRLALERSGLSGFEFFPTAKCRIVAFDWEPFRAGLKPILPDYANEPIELLLKGAHSEWAARAGEPVGSTN